MNGLRFPYIYTHANSYNYVTWNYLGFSQTFEKMNDDDDAEEETRRRPSEWQVEEPQDIPSRVASILSISVYFFFLLKYWP